MLDEFARAIQVSRDRGWTLQFKFEGGEVERRYYPASSTTQSVSLTTKTFARGPSAATRPPEQRAVNAWAADMQRMRQGKSSDLGDAMAEAGRLEQQRQKPEPRPIIGDAARFSGIDFDEDNSK